MQVYWSWLYASRVDCNGPAGPIGKTGARGKQGKDGKQGQRGKTGARGRTGARGGTGQGRRAGDTFWASSDDEGPHFRGGSSALR
eukprot:SAG22_NODE_14550_length_371_cov_2.738971_1_plen_84_part_10